MDSLLTDLESKFFKALFLLFANLFIYFAKMSESAFQTPIQNKIEDQTPNQTKANELEFDCLESIDFKDPNEDDLIRNFDFEKENVVGKTDLKPKLLRNRTHTRLYKAATEKKGTLSPISKKKKLSKIIPYTNKKTIKNVNERLYNAAQRRQPTYKTLAELVQEFDKKTRVYEDENANAKKLNKTNFKKISAPKSPKLLSKNRNRARTALSQIEKDELIARTIKKNTFKAQPINKKIFSNYAVGIPKVCPISKEHDQKKSAIKDLELGLHSTRRLEMRKEKTQAIQTSIENVNFVFKARPMPIFKKVPVVLRNNQLIKKQTSDLYLSKNLKKMTNTIVKQTSDSTLIRIVQDVDLINNNEFSEEKNEHLSDLNDCTVQSSHLIYSEIGLNELMSNSLNENFSKFKIEEETSICEIKSLEAFEELDLKSFVLNSYKVEKESEVHHNSDV